ncbi:GDSL-type esterase/lipase family protein [Compostibacter hankyongensis]|uniref:GDSL-type esterase/lipase family protein n=1 Tax=Compostibacter hankyongensis TaxID=1007089 RepID=UPI0031E542B7
MQWLLWLGICWAGKAQAQTPSVDQHQNYIHNDTALYDFFGKLQKTDSNVVRILHIGDSHLQAGFFPGEARKALQQTFGNAGRGFVFPYHLMKTNGPDGYRWHNTGYWRDVNLLGTGVRAGSIAEDIPVGLGGYTLYSQSSAAALEFTFTGAAAAGETIRSAVLLTGGAAADTLDIPYRHVTLPRGVAALQPIQTDSLADFRYDSVSFSTPSRSFEISWKGKGAAKTPLEFYGAVLYSGEPGILYNATGVNSARFKEYNESWLFFRQLSYAKADLIIISLGTNEGMGRVDLTELKEDIDRLVTRIHTAAPGSALLFTLPGDVMLRRYRTVTRKTSKGPRRYRSSVLVHDPYIAAVRDAMTAYCREHGLAYWDMYRVMGGAGSFSRWRSRGLAASDGVHYTVKGYEMQGGLMAAAIKKAYGHFLLRQGK